MRGEPVVEAAEEYRMKPELTAPAEDETRVSTLSTLCTFIASIREHVEHVEHVWVKRWQRQCSAATVASLWHDGNIMAAMSFM